MSLITLNFQSHALVAPATITVLLPPLFFDINDSRSYDEIYKPIKKLKTLFLFHGACADSSSWLHGSNIQRYAAEHNLAVVLPSVANSFYANLEHGSAYWTFISEELPRYVRSVLPLSDKREDNFVAGLSMGGYGALKLGLNKPDQFAAAISLSGVVDIVAAFKNPIHPIFSIEDYFGSFEKLEKSYNDLFTQIKILKNQDVSIPRLYLACGTEDFLYEMNIKFRDFLIDNSIDFTFEEGPGIHDWGFWDKYIQRGLDWLER
ncbi:MAG TPA: esterase [Anaerolineaceae bacterium]|nr:esterase [Anaerolineaceae bacterium]